MSQAITHRCLQQTANNKLIAAAASTVAVQHVQTPIEFDVPVFEGDSAACWLTWSKRVVYHTRACGFETELAAAEGEGLSVGAHGFERSNVDPVSLENAHAAWMKLISNFRKMVLKVAQRSETPNDAWRNSNGRSKETREIICLSQEINEK